MSQAGAGAGGGGRPGEGGPAAARAAGAAGGAPAGAAPRDGPRTVRELLPVVAGFLAERGVDEARLDAELLLAHVIGVPRLKLYTDHDRPLDEDELARYRAAVRRRANREPVAYVTGRRGFHGLELEVGPGVLVPRPETEHLVEVGLAALGPAVRARPRRRASEPPAGAGEAGATGVGAAGAGAAGAATASEAGAAESEARGDVPAAPPRSPVVVDVGTGSGCVALALLAAAPGVRAVAIDRSAAALAFARRNAVALGLADRLLLVRGDLLGPVAAGAADVVLSNPPYVLPGEAAALAPEVARHEPPEALFDADGLPLTAALARGAARALRPGGLLAVETGQGSAAQVRAHLEAAGLVDPATTPDLTGIERVVAGRRPAG